MPTSERRLIWMDEEEVREIDAGMHRRVPMNEQPRHAYNGSLADRYEDGITEADLHAATGASGPHNEEARKKLSDVFSSQSTPEGEGCHYGGQNR
jgi:hypothetical protein